MPPCLAAQDERHVGLCYAEHVGDLSLSETRHGSNPSHLILLQFGVIVFRSATLPALPDHIAHVVLMIPEKQVFRIHTGAVVAMMADEHVLRDGAEALLPNKTMSFTRRSTATERHVYISERVEATSLEDAPAIDALTSHGRVCSGRVHCLCVTQVDIQPPGRIPVGPIRSCTGPASSSPASPATTSPHGV